MLKVRCVHECLCTYAHKHMQQTQRKHLLSSSQNCNMLLTILTGISFISFTIILLRYSCVSSLTLALMSIKTVYIQELECFKLGFKKWHPISTIILSWLNSHVSCTNRLIHSNRTYTNNMVN